jgi:hypothetical protein
VEFEPPHPAAASPSGILATKRWPPGMGLTLRLTWSRYRQVRAPSFSPAVPPACHKQRAPAVSSGQPRSLRGGRWAGHTSLTWGGGGGRNCMACKRSGVQIPSAPPQSTRGNAAPGQPQPAAVPQQTPVWQARRQHRAPPGNLNARPISSDVSVATPGPGGGWRGPPYPGHGDAARASGPGAGYRVVRPWPVASI